MKDPETALAAPVKEVVEALAVVLTPALLVAVVIVAVPLAKTKADVDVVTEVAKVEAPDPVGAAVVVALVADARADEGTPFPLVGLRPPPLETIALVMADEADAAMLLETDAAVEVGATDELEEMAEQERS